jgi:rhamnose transport system permease protein
MIATVLTYLRSRITSWEWLLGAFAMVLVMASSATTLGFSDAYNLESSISRMSAKALFVLPLVFLIIAREIDISVASIAGLSGITYGIVVQAGGPHLVAVAVALITGLACGAINGFFVAVLRLPSLVVTLGSLALFRGLCYVLVGGTPISPLPDELISFANKSVGNTFIPLTIVPFLILAPIVAIILHRTVFGRRVYAIGGNPVTARYAGVRSRSIVFRLFLASGVVASIAGIIQIGITSSAAPDSAVGFELDAITVVFLGGVSFLGGKGKLSGVIWALVVVIAVRSTLQLRNFGAYGQAAIVGLILIFSLLLANLGRRHSAARATRRARLLRLSPEGNAPSNNLSQTTNEPTNQPTNP